MTNLIHGKLAHVWQIFILQQINVEKNGFHSLTDWQVLLHTIENYISNSYFLLESEAKWQYTSLLGLDVKSNSPEELLQAGSWSTFLNSSPEKMTYSGVKMRASAPK